MAKKLRARKMQDFGSVSLIPIMNLVSLLIPFLLYTAAFVQFACIQVASPQFQSRSSVSPPQEDETPALNLMLMITDQGFRLAASGGVLPEGCASAEGAEGSQGAPTVPLNAGAEGCTDSGGYPQGPALRDRQALRLGPPSCAYNFERLGECIERIKEEYPDETRIIISGEPRVDYDVLIRAMDASRGTDDSPMFPEVVLSSGVA